MPRLRVDLRSADLVQGEVAEGPAPVPALVALLREQPLRRGGGIDLLGLEPLDTREAVPLLSAPLRIEEVVGERLRLRLGEAEGAKPRQGVFGPQPG